MRLENFLILCQIVLIFSCCKVFTAVVINTCCEHGQAYDTVKDKCVLQHAVVEGQSASKTRHGAPAMSFITLPRAFVKILDGRNDTENIEFSLMPILPISTCMDGNFRKSFCISADEGNCVHATMEVLQLTTRGELKVGNQYYSALEYCVTRVEEKSIDFRICNPTCTGEVPCVRKCCDVDQVRNLSIIEEVVCVPSDAVAWQPHFYISPSRSAAQQRIQPHYFISPPEVWCSAPEDSFPLEQREETSGQLNWLFRIGTNRNIFYRTSRYSWKDQKDTWNYSCVDGAINTLPLPQDDPDTFQGIEEEDALYECLPGPPPSRIRSTGQLVLYGLARIISCIFLLATLVVYLLLWKRQNVHGWTLMSYCLSQLVTFLFYAWKYYHSATAVNTGEVEALCVFMGVAINFFFISAFCWMTMINFDLWWTFRSLQIMSRSSRGVQRYVAYAAVSLGTPTIFVAAALALDYTYGSDPENGVIVPEYGKKTCGPEPHTAQWVFQFGPAGIFWLFNIFFFASTVYAIFRHQEVARSARASSTNQADSSARAKLFGKLLIVMGIPFAFEFISTLDEGTEYRDASWYWVVFDMVNYLQGVYIFFIFVFKGDVGRQLAEQYSFFARFIPNIQPESKASKDTTSSTAIGGSSSQETKF